MIRIAQICCLILSLLSSLPLNAGEPYLIYEQSGALSPKQPQAFVAENGVVHLTFGLGEEVYYCSVDNEVVTKAQRAFKVPNMSLGMRRGPRIAKAGKAIVITVIGGPQGKGRDGDLLSYRSEDDGKTWSEPIRVNDVESSAREGLHAMAATPEGKLWCVWLDLRDKGTQLFAASSTDEGKTWSANKFVYRSPDGSICECCHPSIIASGNAVHILFRNSLAGNRDMYLVTSNDGGESYGAAKRLGLQHWNLNACPMDGGMLTKTADGELLSVWRRGSVVHWTGGDKSIESTLGAGEQPWVTSNSDGSFATWLARRDGDLIVGKLDFQNPEKIATNARDPIIVSSESPTPQVHVFWEQRNGDRTSLMGKTIK